ncbi:hypothetical protein MEX01_53390 [Methylorubrum extorquens]|nr:hypothetical protein MEX01_53390 [Methylorubrum extorquens]
MVDPKAPTIRIWCGIAHQGVDERDRGRRMFFLDYVSPDGKVSVVWDGYTYDDAVLAAEVWEKKGCVVVDDVE